MAMASGFTLHTSHVTRAVAHYTSLRLGLQRASLPALIAALVSSAALMMKSYMCVICGFVYEEEKGDPTSGIPPGTRWDDVPLSWRCPDCGAGKEDFEMVEV